MYVLDTILSSSSWTSAGDATQHIVSHKRSLWWELRWRCGCGSANWRCREAVEVSHTCTVCSGCKIIFLNPSGLVAVSP